jgi:hypothetical protein
VTETYTTEAQAIELGADYAYLSQVGVTYLRRGRPATDAPDTAVFTVVATSSQFLAGEEFLEHIDSARLVYIANTRDADTEV